MVQHYCPCRPWAATLPSHPTATKRRGAMDSDTTKAGTIDFINMADGTRDEYELLERHYRPFSAGLPDRLMSHLQLLAGDLMGYKIDRFQHSLQSATRAQRDGADEEMVVAAL